MEKQLPESMQIAFANADKLTDDYNIVYTNFFNLNLRWICGYNNDFISEKILNYSNILKSRPEEFKSIYNGVASVLIREAGKNFKTANLFEENTIEILNHLYSDNKRFVVYLSNNPEYEKSDFKSFLELLPLEKNIRSAKRTVEGFSVTQIKNFFKNYKNYISVFVLSPVLIDQGIFISQETAQLIEKLCRKYSIPFIWDESFTFIYRTGSFYLLDKYKLNPDFISIDTNVYQDKKVHILVINKRVKRRIRKTLSGYPGKKEVANLILLLSIFDFTKQYDMTDYVKSISYRLRHKLFALSSNLKKNFEFECSGLITQLYLPTIGYASKLARSLKKNHIIFYYDNNLTITFIPQIILTTHSVDLLIQQINNFFRSGIKLKEFRDNE